MTVTDPEMVTLVAKAIFSTKPPHPQATFDDMPAVMQGFYVEQATAAVRAMREYEAKEMAEFMRWLMSDDDAASPGSQP